MTMLVDTLAKFAQELKPKSKADLTLLFKFNKIICKEILDKLENGGLSVYFGFGVEK